MPNSLPSRTRRTVQHLWEDKVGAKRGTLKTGGVSYVEWPGFDAAVVVDIEGAHLVAGPAEAIELLRGLSSRQLSDAEATASALQPLRPELTGKALLSYADATTFAPVDVSSRARQADRRAMEEVVAKCEVDDRDESGLPEMTSWFVTGDGGAPVAASGYEGWSPAVAHCGVAVIAEHRGKGWGRSVASAAVGHALGDHDVVQWRSRDTNRASTRLGGRLGFAQVGTQTAFDLHP